MFRELRDADLHGSVAAHTNVDESCGAVLHAATLLPLGGLSASIAAAYLMNAVRSIPRLSAAFWSLDFIRGLSRTEIGTIFSSVVFMVEWWLCGFNFGV